MSSESDDDPIMRSSSEHYDRVGVSFRWPQILASASSIFFGFLLDIEVNPPSYFTYTDHVILLAGLYSVAVAVAMFIMPVIYHMTHYRNFVVERFLSNNQKYVLTGIICVMLGMYLALGLVLNSKLSIHLAYAVASLPFICIIYEFIRKAPTNPIKSTSTEHYDRSSNDNYRNYHCFSIGCKQTCICCNHLTHSRTPSGGNLCIALLSKIRSRKSIYYLHLIDYATAPNLYTMNSVFSSHMRYERYD